MNPIDRDIWWKVAVLDNQWSDNQWKEIQLGNGAPPPLPISQRILKVVFQVRATLGNCKLDFGSEQHLVIYPFPLMRKKLIRIMIKATLGNIGRWMMAKI